MKISIEIDTQNKSNVAEVITYLGTFLGSADSVTEKAVEAPKKKKVTPSKAKEEKAVEAPVEEKPKTEKAGKVTLEMVKSSAQNAVQRTDRIKVKEVIGEYANKLAEVKPSDFEDLYIKLENLGA